MDIEDGQVLIGANILLLLSLLKRKVVPRLKKLRLLVRKVLRKREFFASKAIEQTIVFSNFFHKLFRVDFTFHLVETHARVKVDKQLVVVASCRLQFFTLGKHSIMGLISIA